MRQVRGFSSNAYHLLAHGKSLRGLRGAGLPGLRTVVRWGALGCAARAIFSLTADRFAASAGAACPAGARSRAAVRARIIARYRRIGAGDPDNIDVSYSVERGRPLRNSPSGDDYLW